MSKVNIPNISKLNLKLWFSILNSYTPKNWEDLEDEKYAEKLLFRAGHKFKNNKF